jgi:hypothetical protein
MPVVINEVFYDPEGKDAGYEFVEFFNRSDEPVCLEGWRFETGNGSYENRWKHEWTGSDADEIGPNCFFVIGEDLVGTAVSFTTELDLQNGPDGCRLITPDGGLDVVGWGSLVYPEYFEDSPAAEGASGSSLGRDPDGHDSDRNSDDLSILDRPSPGDYNHPPCDLALERAALSGSSSDNGTEIEIACRVLNAGTQACGSGAWLYVALGLRADSTRIVGNLLPEEAIRIGVRLPNPGGGLHLVRVWVSSASDRWQANDTLATTVALSPPPVVINEIMFRPATEDCEWIELFLRGVEAVDLRAWTIEDHRGRARRIADDSLVIESGDFLMLVDDAEAFAVTHPDINHVRIITPHGGWPALNDTDGPFGFADAVVIRDAYGTSVDSVAYREDWCKPGVSIERIDPLREGWDSANWSPHYGAGRGSPGSENSVSFYLPETGGILSLSPPTFAPGEDGEGSVVAISVRLPSPCRVWLSSYDINGRLVRRVIDGAQVERTRHAFWDGLRDDGSKAPMGIYIIVLKAEVTASDVSYRARSPVVLLRR